MGNVQVSNASQTIKDYQQFMDSIYNKLNVNSACQSTAANEFSLFTGAIPDPKTNMPLTCEFVAEGTTITVGQMATGDCTNVTKTSDQISSEVSTNIEMQIDQFLREQQNSKQGWLTLAFNAQITNATNITELGNTIKQSVRNTTSQICNTTAETFNDNDVVLCGVYTDDNLNFSQVAVSNAYVSCTVDLMIKAWQKDTTLQKVAEAAFTGQVSEQKGIGSLFGWIIAIVVGIVVIALIIGVIFLFSEGGGKKEEPEGGEEAQLLRMEELKGEFPEERREGLFRKSEEERGGLGERGEGLGELEE